MNATDLHTFEQARPALLGIARRILASRTDAEDAVQDCFLRWQDADRTAIDSPPAWLTTVCTRRCLDLLRAADRSRVDYAGFASGFNDSDTGAVSVHHADDHEHASLDSAFLILLERLTAKERAAYVLHEIFEQPFRQIAATLHMKEAACNKLVERARVHIANSRTRCAPDAATLDRLLRAFRSAVASGNPAQLAVLLAHDVRTRGRNGATTTVALRILDGGNFGDDSRADPHSDHRRIGQDRRESQRAA